MENLLWVMGDGAANDKSLEFACYLAQETRSRLRGVLLAGAGVKEHCAAAAMVEEGHASAVPVGGRAKNDGGNDAAIRYFKKICKKEGISCDINRLEGDPLQDMVLESRIADVLLIGGAALMDADGCTSFNPLVWALLQVAECPVVIAPGQPAEIDEIILTYDGSASSLFAFRRFAHLFPCFNSKRIIVVVADHFPEIKHERLIRDQLDAYYPQITFETLYAKDFDRELFDFYQRRNNCFIVMGASGKANLSRLVSGGNTYWKGAVIEHPVFIAHF